MKKLVICICILVSLIGVSVATPIIVFLQGEVTYNRTLAELRNNIYYQYAAASYRNESPNQIVLTLITPGGSMVEAIAIVDYLNSLKKQGWQIDTVASGICMSAGMMILQAGNRRYATEHTMLMTHAPVFVSPAEKYTTLKDLKELEANLNSANERQMSIFMNRMRKTRQWMAYYFTSKEFMMDAVQAYQLGFIDEVIKDVRYN